MAFSGLKENLKKIPLWSKTILTVFYKLFYFTGISVIRKVKKCRRSFSRFYKATLYPAIRRFYYLATYPLRLIKRFAVKKWRSLQTRTLERKNIYSTLAGSLRQRNFRCAFQQLGLLLKRDWRGVLTLLNYAMPVCAVALLCMTIQYFNNQTLAISVEYSGKNIGYILKEEDFTTAEEKVEERIVYEEYKKPFDFVPKFTLTRINKEDITSTDELTDEIIRASGNEITEANGLYVDNRFLGAVEDSESLLMVLDGILDDYKDENIKDVEFSNKIELKNGLYPVSGIVPVKEIDDILNSEVDGEIIYTAKSGDSPWSIAAENGISLSQLRSMNENIDNLTVGQEVKISQAQNFLGVRVTKIEEYEQSIPYKTSQVPSASLFKGYSETTTEGRNGIEAIKAEVTYENGVEVERNVLSVVTVQPVQDRVITYGTRTLQSFRSSSSNTPAFIWPVKGGYVSCGFYGYKGHTGMDIAAARGTPIYAAADGVVTLSRTFWPLGSHIIITHGDGVQTCYAHASALYVKEGQVVKQGQLIAAVGTSGNSTGYHCHFEIRLNGKYVNPANYVSR